MPGDQVAAKQDIGFASEDMRLYGRRRSPGTWASSARSIRAGIRRTPSSCSGVSTCRAEQKIKGLSHGQRVKAALLLVLARRPRLLVLDEPTTGLDPVARHEVLGELMEVLADEDRTILFSSHNTLDVEQISDQITFIDRGRIIDSGDKESFLDRWRRDAARTCPPASRCRASPASSRPTRQRPARGA